MLWNQKIAPAVSDAVVKGSGSDTVAGGQQKVANTALYVLMQRSIVSGCPLVGQGQWPFLHSFQRLKSFQERPGVDYILLVK